MDSASKDHRVAGFCSEASGSDKHCGTSSSDFQGSIGNQVQPQRFNKPIALWHALKKAIKFEYGVEA
jgi:hypothetical protein